MNSCFANARQDMIGGGDMMGPAAFESSVHLDQKYSKINFFFFSLVVIV